jgi:hypothetical protein
MHCRPYYLPATPALINNDPSLISFRGNEQTALDQATAARRAAIQSLAVQYGGLPSSVSDSFGDLDARTLDLAKSNQFSDLANLSRNYDQTVLGIKRALAARGALNSGELPYGLDQANLGRGQQEYTLGNNFANAFQQALNNYAAGVQNVKSQEAQAIAQAAQNVYGNPAYRPTDATMTNHLAGSYEKYGRALYQGPGGTLYNADGSVYGAGEPGGGGGGGGDSAPAETSGDQTWQQFPTLDFSSLPPAPSTASQTGPAVTFGPVQPGNSYPTLDFGQFAAPAAPASSGYGNAYQRRKQAV